MHTSHVGGKQNTFVFHCGLKCNGCWTIHYIWGKDAVVKAVVSSTSCESCSKIKFGQGAVEPVAKRLTSTVVQIIELPKPIPIRALTPRTQPMVSSRIYSSITSSGGIGAIFQIQ